MSATSVLYLSIVFFSMFKFAAGPAIGGAKEIPFYITGNLTAFGMILAVVIFSFIGEEVRKRLLERKIKKNKKFKIRKKHRTMVRTWNKFGILGVSFLTPLFLTPIGGTILAVSWGVPRQKIILYMSVSAILWGNIQAFIFLVIEQGILHMF